MELETVLNIRKSIRSFTGEPASEAELNAVLRAANEAPVGMGKYGSVHLTVVRNKDILGELEKNTAAVFNADDRSFLYHAPELIIVSTAVSDNVGYSNAAIIAHNMALEAVSLGLGVCHIWGCIMALNTNKSIVAKLSVPEGFTPACAVAIGKTDEVYAERKIPENRISLNIV